MQVWGGPSPQTVDEVQKLWNKSLDKHLSEVTDDSIVRSWQTVQQLYRQPAVVGDSNKLEREGINEAIWFIMLTDSEIEDKMVPILANNYDNLDMYYRVKMIEMAKNEDIFND